jgi:hypothetical protein
VPTRVVLVPATDPLAALAAFAAGSVARGNFVVVVDLTQAAQDISSHFTARMDASQFRIVDGLADPDAGPDSHPERPGPLTAAMRSARGLIQQKGRRSHVIVYNIDALRHLPVSLLEEMANYVETTRLFPEVVIDYVVKDLRSLHLDLREFLNEFVDSEVHLKAPGKTGA